MHLADPLIWFVFAPQVFMCTINWCPDKTFKFTAVVFHSFETRRLCCKSSGAGAGCDTGSFSHTFCSENDMRGFVPTPHTQKILSLFEQLLVDKHCAIITRQHVFVLVLLPFRYSKLKCSPTACNYKSRFSGLLNRIPAT